MNKQRTLMVDLDGTICDERPTFERSLAEPLAGALDALHRFRRAGWRIIIHTARTWSEYTMTEAQLRQWGVPFDVLICGKPVADVSVDDRALAFAGNWLNIEWQLEGR